MTPEQRPRPGGEAAHSKQLRYLATTLLPCLLASTLLSCKAPGMAALAEPQSLAELVSNLLPLPVPPRLEQLDAPVKRAYQKKLKKLEGLFSDTRSDGQAHKELAESYGALGNWFFAYRLFDGARAAYSNAIAIEPMHPRWSFLQGSVEVKLGENVKARNHLTKALSLDPLNAEISLALARLDLVEGKTSQSARHLDSLLALQPNNPVALLLRGQSSYQEGRYQEAIGFLERGRSQAPQATDLRYALGMALRDDGQVDRAEALLSEGRTGRHAARPATTRSPWMANVRALLSSTRSAQRRGTSAYRQGRIEEALGHFTEATKISPENPLPHFNRLLALIDLRRIEAARREQKVLTKIAPQHPQFLHLSGLLELADGKPDQAILNFQSALKANPSHTSSRLQLASLSFQAGSFAQGRQHFRQVLQRQPENSVARLRWILAEGSAGKLIEACNVLPKTPPTSLSPAMATATARLLSIAPEFCDRAGERALQLARLVFDGNASVLHAETLAMAQAAQGRFTQAAKIQRQILEQLRARDNNVVAPTDLARIEERLVGYLREDLPTKPWVDKEAEALLNSNRQPRTDPASLFPRPPTSNQVRP